MLSEKNEGFQCQEHNTYNHLKIAFQQKNKKFFQRVLSSACNLSVKRIALALFGAKRLGALAQRALERHPALDSWLRIWAALPLRAEAQSLALEQGAAPLERLDADEKAAQNFVDIMVKIHNKIQNIKSLMSNKGAFRPLLRKSGQGDCFSSWVSQGY